MNDVAPIASLLAATLAAILAAINLYVSGRRERVKWVREALVDTFVNFLAASYNHKDLCKRIYWLPPAPEQTDEVRKLRQQAETTYDEIMDCITRMRVLTTADLAGKAFQLRCHNRDYYRLVTAGDSKPTVEADEQARRAFDNDRAAFIEAAKKVLAL